jgi:F-type H+-transporting ATPase subunit a
MLHISVKAQEIFNIGNFPITNSLLSSIILIVIFIILYFFFDFEPVSNKVNTFITFLLNSVYIFLESITGDKTADVFPLLGGFFFFIILSNWFGLLPGVGSIVVIEHVGEEVHRIPLLRAATADLNGTIALAIASVGMIQYYGIKYCGFAGYSKKFFNLSNPINFALGILEMFSEFSRVLSFSFRLFGNIFAGEVLIAVMAFLVPVLASFPFLLLEIFVGFIQALVFTMLTAVFISIATVSHEEH